MLASILPGIRNLRTPLTVGYMWIVILWLWKFDQIPSESPEDGGLIDHLFDIHSHLGTTVALAAVSFIAYLFGSIISVLVENPSVFQLLMLVGLIPGFRYRDRYYEKNCIERLVTLVSQTGLAKSDVDLRVSLVHVRNLRGLAKTALLVKSVEVYDEFDRFTAEAEFRINISPPLIALGYLIGMQVNWAWLAIAIITVLILLRQAAINLVESNSVMFRAFETRLIVYDQDRGDVRPVHEDER